MRFSNSHVAGWIDRGVELMSRVILSHTTLIVLDDHMFDGDHVRKENISKEDKHLQQATVMGRGEIGGTRSVENLRRRPLNLRSSMMPFSG